MTREQKLKQKQLTADDRVLTFDTFYNMLEALEEYIEKSGSYPDFIEKRQVYKKTVPRSANLSLNKAESLFKTQLLIFFGMVDDSPSSLREEIKKEYYRWINAVEINANNCLDEKLKHFLLEVNNILDGNGEKIFDQTKKYLDDKEKTNPINLWDLNKLFGAIQDPLDKNRERGDLLKGKKWNEVKVEKMSGGDEEEGEKTFNDVTQQVTDNHNDFDFFAQQRRQLKRDAQLREYREEEERYEKMESIIKNIRESNSWDIKKSIILDSRRGNYYEGEVLVHESTEKKYDNRGLVIFVPGKMYTSQDFEGRWEEVKRSINISIIEEVKQDRNVWKILDINNVGITLVHQSAEMPNERINLRGRIYERSRFTDKEWTEIKKILSEELKTPRQNLLPNPVKQVKQKDTSWDKKVRNPRISFIVDQFRAGNVNFIKEWKIENVPTYGGFKIKKDDIILIHRSAKKDYYRWSDTYNKFKWGGLKVDNLRIFYDWEFNRQAWTDIVQTLQNVNSCIIWSIRQSYWDWKIVEIITDYNENKQEKVICRSSIVSCLDNYYQEGKLIFENNQIYRVERFNEEEKKQIDSILINSQQNNWQQKRSLLINSDNSNNHNPNRTLLITTILGIASFLIITSSLLIKKRLKKLKK